MTARAASVLGDLAVGSLLVVGALAAYGLVTRLLRHPPGLRR